MPKSNGRKRLVNIDTHEVVLVFHNHGPNADLHVTALSLCEEFSIELADGRYRIEDMVLLDCGNHVWRRRRSSFEVLDNAEEAESG